MTRIIRRSIEQANAIAWAGAHAAMRELESTGLPLDDREQVTRLLTSLYEANHEALRGEIAIDGEEPKRDNVAEFASRLNRGSRADGPPVDGTGKAAA